MGGMAMYGVGRGEWDRKGKQYRGGVEVSETMVRPRQECKAISTLSSSNHGRGYFSGQSIEEFVVIWCR